MDTQPDTSETTETPKADTAEKLSPKGMAALQGLDADIAQAEEVKAEALKAGNLKIAGEADQAVTHMRLERLRSQPEVAVTATSDPSQVKPITTLAPAATGTPPETPMYKPGYTAETLPMTEGEPIPEKPTREKPQPTPEGGSSGNPERGG